MAIPSLCVSQREQNVMITRNGGVSGRDESAAKWRRQMTNTITDPPLYESNFQGRNRIVNRILAGLHSCPILSYQKLSLMHEGKSMAICQRR